MGGGREPRLALDQNPPVSVVIRRDVFSSEEPAP